MKPTAGKILAAIVVAFLFVPFIEYDNGTRCFTVPCPASDIGSIAMYALSSHCIIYNILFVNVIVGLLASYVVVSIAFYAINKK